jgi:hypothetical protein
MSVSYDRAGALAELKELEKEEKDLLYPNRKVKYINLQHAF